MSGGLRRIRRKTARADVEDDSDPDVIVVKREPAKPKPVAKVSKIKAMQMKAAKRKSGKDTAERDAEAPERPPTGEVSAAQRRRDEKEMEEIGKAGYLSEPGEHDVEATGKGLQARPVQLPFGSYRLVSRASLPFSTILIIPSARRAACAASPSTSTALW